MICLSLNPLGTQSKFLHIAVLYSAVITSFFFFFFFFFQGNEVSKGGSTNQLCASGLSVPQGKGMFFRCYFTVFGRYVYIRIPGDKKILTLCEVDVYSTINPSKIVYIFTTVIYRHFSS